MISATRLLLLSACFSGFSGYAFAQKTYTADDYKQAERWMSYNVTPLVHHTLAGITYLPDGRVFYRDPDKSSTAYVIADPAKGTKAAAFDNVKLAAALGTASKTKFNASRLSLSDYRPEAEGFAISARGQVFHCNVAATRCTMEAPPPQPVEQPQSAPVGVPPAEASVTQTGIAPRAKAQPVATNQQPRPAMQPAAAVRPAAPNNRRRGSKGPLNVSPDKKLAVFIRDNNLWLRVMATGAEKQLTSDGVEDFGYATDNAGWQHSDAAIATWSADSKLVATFQLDQRNTGMMYLVPVTNRHPKLEAWHYPLVGDKVVTTIQPVILDVNAGSVVRLKTAPLQHRSMECDDVSCDGDGRWNDVAFAGDDKHLAFVSTSRDHKDEWVRVADTSTGDVRDVFHEHVSTYYGWQAKTDWKYLPETNEFLWVSERSNYAQIYLYDLTTGKLKNQVTHGDGPVWDIPFVDAKSRTLYFSATGKEPGQDPYWRKLYRVNFDGSGQTLLTPEAADHEITMASDGRTFVDAYSTLDTPQSYVVRDGEGKVLLELAKQDISELTSAGWKPPLSVTVKARDGKTDLWGYLWRPTNFDASQKYPVIDYIYPGPQDGSCSTMGPHGFEAARGDHQALAELGFAVVCIDGLGNPHRSKNFHDAHASKPEDMGEDTIPDQVAAIRQLAAKYAWIDGERVGIWGHSGGGNATVSAMFHFPEFFKVGWSESGNHDNRDYEDDWDERWAGLEVIGKDGKSNYEAHANQNYAKNLKGKLMLVHGTMDDNVPPSNTLLVAQALMKANIDFDMLMVTNEHHGYADDTPYITRRRWDYFVQNLAGGTPPHEFRLKSYDEIIRALYGEQ